MGFLDYKVRPRVLVVGNGHPYDRTAFMAMLESVGGKEFFLVEHPIAEAVLNHEATREVDAIVLYDMPGGWPRRGPDYALEPSDAFKYGFNRLLMEGTPILALHHAIAGWSKWEDYSEVLGGKLAFYPTSIRGRNPVGGGIRMGVDYKFEVTDPTHPIFAGIPNSFDLNDELFLYDVFEDDVNVLARSNYSATVENFHSLELTVTGEPQSNRGWVRPPGSTALVWTKRAYNSSLVYIQPGHYPHTYANENYRRLVHNALDWVIEQTRMLKLKTS